jgi:MFS family permease
LFAALYLAEGAPIGYIWWALPTRLREAGVPIEQVTALAATLTLPWTLKFLWAPLVDALRPRHGGLRVWITATQIAMGLTLLPIAGLDPIADYRLLAGLLIVHAICAATQDVSIDALAIVSIPASERGRTTGWMQVGMLTGRATFGGVALWAEGYLGAGAVIWAMVLLVWTTSGLVWLVDERAVAGVARHGRVRLARFAATLAMVLRSPSTWLGFAIALTAGAAMEATGSVAGPLMIDRGLAKEHVGWFFALPAVVCMALGALLGGRLSDRRRREDVLTLMVVATAVAVGAVAFAAGRPPGSALALLLASLALAYAVFGALTAAWYAVFMDLTEPELGGTQFSAFMGAVNACGVWSTFTVGRLTAAVDYSMALALLAAASLTSLPLIAWLRRRGVGAQPSS